MSSGTIDLLTKFLHARFFPVPVILIRRSKIIKYFPIVHTMGVFLWSENLLSKVTEVLCLPSHSVCLTVFILVKFQTFLFSFVNFILKTFFLIYKNSYLELRKSLNSSISSFKTFWMSTKKDGFFISDQVICQNKPISRGYDFVTVKVKEQRVEVLYCNKFGTIQFINSVDISWSKFLYTVTTYIFTIDITGRPQST